MTREEELQLAAPLAKKLNKLAAEEAKAMTEATKRVAARYAEKRRKLLESAPEAVRGLVEK